MTSQINLIKTIGLFIIAVLLLSSTPQNHPPTILKVQEREITVNGKKALILEVAQENGLRGISLNKGDYFNVVVENHLKSPTGIHWHGLLLPNSQDGVPYVTQLPIPPGGKYPYYFLCKQSGTYWMHAHYGLQEQRLLAAPFILHDPANSLKVQEVVFFLSDFTFKNPEDIFKELRAPKSDAMPMNSMHATTDLNDVKYDAYLTNWTTLADPEIIQVTPDQPVLLRIINGSSSSNFFINTGSLEGEILAVDGNDILPLKGSQFEIAVAQRLDILVKIPTESNHYPILAQGEGTNLQTGLFLSTSQQTIPILNQTTKSFASALSYTQEKKLKAKSPLSKKEINRRLILNLEGNMATYTWLLNGRAWPHFQPLYVKEGERVELTFINKTMMSHPMHLHGHFFQVTEINGEPLQGALRDTVLVLPQSTVKVQFDANNPGNWALHCHNLYHLQAGMMTTLNYERFNGPVFQIKPEI